MWFSSWLRKRTVPRKQRPARRFRPQLEALEGRIVPTTFLVNTTDDVLGHAGVLSLRQAIIDANVKSDADTIVLPAGHYKLTRAGSNEYHALTGDLDITNRLTINGAGAGTTFVDATGLGDRVFQIHSTTVTLSGMTIEGGRTVAIAGGWQGQRNGGGVYNAGSLTVNNCFILGNTTASGGLGGGIYNAGPLTVNNSVISGNSAGDGGGIFNENINTERLTVSNSTLSGNSAVVGGGIANFAPPTVTVTIRDSTLSRNTAQTGGGIDNVGTMTVSSCTFSNNSADYGGGIDNVGTMTVSYCTLSNNSAGGHGGGIDNVGTLTVSNSTLSGNSAVQGGAIYNHRYVLSGTIVYRGTVTLQDSTLSGNTATDFGGGIANFETLTLTHSTVLNNSAPVGADLYNLGLLYLSSDSIIGVTGP